MQRLNSDIVARGPDWHLARVEAERKPLLGALLRLGPRRQERYVESGGVILGRPGRVEILGPGHKFVLPADSSCLYVPVGGREPAVEWVLSVGPNAAPEELPSVDHSPPARSPVPLPFPEDVPPLGLHPDWARPWLAFPATVSDWADCLDIRATSLTQRLKRLVGETPKRLLTAIRATVAFELADHYRGEGAMLALDAGYASQAHLSADIKARFGRPLRDLLDEEGPEALEWLQLLHSVIR